MEQSKDKLIDFKGTTVGVSGGKENPKGTLLKLSMTPEQAALLIGELTRVASSPNGVKIEIHTRKKVNSNTGMEFDSSFAFVKAIGDAPGAFGKKTYQPKAAPAAGNNAQTVLRNATLKSS